jgi:7,8-dihydropterin-6-yl-methyl-4-(beta-D-ribofuranosyl)aminobenzene 5'-phosphate synthase
MRIVNLIENTPGVPGCSYEHGLSFYIETKKHRLLADSGATDQFLHNAGVLGIDLSTVDTMILSHGHYDHAGGIRAFSGMNPDAKIYLRASAGGEYYHLKADGEKYIGIEKEILKLGQCVFVQGDLEIDDELFLYTDVPGTRYPARGTGCSSGGKRENSFRILLTMNSAL